MKRTSFFASAMVAITLLTGCFETTAFAAARAPEQSPQEEFKAEVPEASVPPYILDAVQFCPRCWGPRGLTNTPSAEPVCYECGTVTDAAKFCLEHEYVTINLTETVCPECAKSYGIEITDSSSEEAFYCPEHDHSLQTISHIDCTDCDGNGFRILTEVEIMCKRCEGDGVCGPCYHCGGTGDNYCDSCGNDGKCSECMGEDADCTFCHGTNYCHECLGFHTTCSICLGTRRCYDRSR